MPSKGRSIGAARQHPSGRGSRKAFARPATRKALFAALDLGTNSCRMLIAEPEGAQFRVIDAFSKSVRLGMDLERTGYLSRPAIDRTIAALRSCATKVSHYEIEHTRFVATEACRRAKNGDKFLKEVRRETGLDLQIIRPSEEARLAVVSCASLAEPESKQLLIVDIGGGSTELVWIDVSEVPPHRRAAAILKLRPSNRFQQSPEETDGARVVDWISVPVGVATLFEKYRDVEEDAARFALMSWYFEEQIGDFAPYKDPAYAEPLEEFQVIGTSGTVTTVGAAHLGLQRYDRSKVDGMRMNSGEVDAVVSQCLELGPEGRRTHPGIGKDRTRLIMAGAAILQTLLRIWPTECIRVADRGLREGMLYSMMSEMGVLDDPGNT